MQFDCTNNVAEYEGLLLGFEQAWKRGIQLLKVFGDSELVVNQVRGLCEVKNARLKRYREVVWDEIECFMAFSISAIPRAQNKVAESMAFAAISFQPLAGFTQS